jgi:hypothetical protein
MRVPKYIKAIAENIRCIGHLTYRLKGVNPVRPAYGIEADIMALEKWATRNYADFKVIKINKQPKHYYAVFEMTDPVAQALEREGYLLK